MQTVTQQGLKDCIYAFLKTQKEAVTTEQLMNQDGIGSAGLQAVQEALEELVEEHLALTTVVGYCAEINTRREPSRGADRGMKELRKLPTMILVGLLVGLYTTFVLENLWNWFATQALHLPVISFWIMYGLVLIISMFKENFSDIDQEISFKGFGILLDACVPEHLKESVSAKLEDLQEGIWGEIVLKVFAKIFSATCTLVIGWAVHTFLL